MKRYAVIDANGKASAFYSDDVSSIPEGAEEVSNVAWQTYIDNQPNCHFDAARSVVIDPPSEAQVQARLMDVVQAHLDSAAREKGYDSIFTAVTYADEPAVTKFQTEGRAMRKWRSLVWDACYQILADVQAGTRTIPTETDLIAELPTLII